MGFWNGKADGPLDKMFDFNRDGSDSWALMEPGTLQEMLEGVLFFEEIDEQIPDKLEVGADTLEWLQKRFEVAK
mgnify:CR=1 FL=1